MNGPIPTIAFMFRATASLRPSPRSSCSSGKGVDIDGAKRAKHIRCVGRAKASWDLRGISVQGGKVLESAPHLSVRDLATLLGQTSIAQTILFDRRQCPVRRVRERRDQNLFEKRALRCDASREGAGHGGQFPSPVMPCEPQGVEPPP